MFSKIKLTYWYLALALVFYLFLTGAYLSIHDWNLTSFVKFGDGPVSNIYIDDSIYVHSDWGHDGQFYYMMARNPFDLQTIESATGAPVWQYQRIIYPSVVYLLSGFGQPFLVSLFLILVNLFAILAGGYFLSKILLFYNLKPWLSLVYMLSAGSISSFTFNLAEPIAYLFVILAIYFFLKQKTNFSVLFLCLSIFTKEITLIVAFGFILYFIIKKQFKKAIVYGLPILLFLLWLIFLNLIFSKSGYLTITTFDLGIPLEGWIIRFKLLFFQDGLLTLFADIFFFLILIATAIYLVKDFFTKISIFNTIGLLFTIFSIGFQPPLILYPKEYTRIFMGFFLFALLSYSVSKNKPLIVLLISYLFFSIFFVSRVLLSVIR